MSDTYNTIRRPEHSTLGDAADRYERDQDAFTAGAQYALDSIVGSTDDVTNRPLANYIATLAAGILLRVHDGRL